MPTRPEMQELVDAHAALPDDELATAIWIKVNDSAAWLVEVLPGLNSDLLSTRPVHFNPGRMFPYPLHLIAANETDLRNAIATNPELAAELAAGEVLHGQELGSQLKQLASSLVQRG